MTTKKIEKPKMQSIDNSGYTNIDQIRWLVDAVSNIIDHLNETAGEALAPEPECKHKNTESKFEKPDKAIQYCMDCKNVIAWSVQTNAAPTEVDTLKKENAKLESEIVRMKSTALHYRDESLDQQLENAELKAENAKLQAQIEDMTPAFDNRMFDSGRVERLETENMKLHSQVDSLQAEVDLVTSQLLRSQDRIQEARACICIVEAEKFHNDKNYKTEQAIQHALNLLSDDNDGDK